MRIGTRLLTTLIAVITLTLPVLAAPEPPASAPAADRMAWFKQARFGMFIHWGIYSVPAGEWKGKGGTRHYNEWIQQAAKIPAEEYEPLATQFNPTLFDADKIVGLAKAAGMKYIVVTAKHHDGFAMYDTAFTDYSVMKATPWKKDPVKMLSEACAKEGLTFCVYYSLPDWHHPEYPAEYSQDGFHGRPNPKADIKKYDEYMRGQMKELLTNYGPIGLVWFDNGGAMKTVDKPGLLEAKTLVEEIHTLQPQTLINDRLGLGADYVTPEQRIPATGLADGKAFEVCMTLTKTNWGYVAKDNSWKSPAEVVQKLVDIASKGGNFLLNVGPKPTGEVPADAERILRAVGTWTSANAESIYGTTPSPFEKTPEWGRITAKGKTLYLHVFAWPKDGVLTVQKPAGKSFSASLLRSPETALSIDDTGDALKIKVPADAPDAMDTVIVLKPE